MNNKEKLIISYLRKNARYTLAYISRMTHIPVSTLFDRIKSYDGKIIKKATCLVDFSKLGFNTRAKVAIKVGKDDREHIQDFLSHHPNTNSLFKVNNGFDYLVECVFSNIKELNDFVDILKGKFSIRNCQVFHVIDDVKREGFLAEPPKMAI